MAIIWVTWCIIFLLTPWVTVVAGPAEVPPGTGSTGTMLSTIPTIIEGLCSRFIFKSPDQTPKETAFFYIHGEVFGFYMRCVEGQSYYLPFDVTPFLYTGMTNSTTDAIGPCPIPVVGEGIGIYSLLERLRNQYRDEFDADITGGPLAHELMVVHNVIEQIPVRIINAPEMSLMLQKEGDITPEKNIKKIVPFFAIGVGVLIAVPMYGAAGLIWFLL